MKWLNIMLTFRFFPPHLWITISTLYLNKIILFFSLGFSDSYTYDEKRLRDIKIRSEFYSNVKLE